MVWQDPLCESIPFFCKCLPDSNSVPGTVVGLGVHQWTDKASWWRELERNSAMQWVARGDQGRVSEEVFEQRSEDSTETSQVTGERVSLHGHTWIREGRFLLDCGVRKGGDLETGLFFSAVSLPAPPFLLCFPIPCLLSSTLTQHRLWPT